MLNQRILNRRKKLLTAETQFILRKSAGLSVRIIAHCACFLKYIIAEFSYRVPYGLATSGL